MANRHSHKKLRAEIRARMASTGESYLGVSPGPAMCSTLRRVPSETLAPLQLGNRTVRATSAAALFTSEPPRKSVQSLDSLTYQLPCTCEGSSRRASDPRRPRASGHDHP